MLSAPQRAWRGGGSLPAWGVAVLLAGSSLILLAAGNLLLAAFPVRLDLRASSTSMQISVDGQTQYLPLAEPLRTLLLVPPEPYRREYQIDGSDSTNNLDLDTGYFARIADSPYYRFQSVLRDEGSFSRWTDLNLRDSEGRLLLQEPEPADGAGIPLPEQFHATLSLRRIEIPRSLELVDAEGGSLRIELNRNDRYLRITRLEQGQPPRLLAEDFFPRDWLPPAAEVGYLATRTIALALALTLLVMVAAGMASMLAARLTRPRPMDGTGQENGVGRLPRSGGMPAFWPGELPGDLEQRAARMAPWLAAGVTLAMALYSSVVLFDRAPRILDGVSYYFQAKLLVTGHLTAPAPPVPQAFPTPFTIVHEGRWFSQYPPGAPLLLAIGFLLGVPWLVEPLLAAAATLLLYGIAQRRYGRRVALLAALLMASSPFLALQAGSFMSHLPAMFLATLFLYAATRYEEKPGLRWALLASTALGFVFLVREVVTPIYGVSVAGYLFFVFRRRGHPRARRDLALAVAWLALFGAAYLLYNLAVTGSPFLLPRLLFFGGDRFGFGEGIGFYGAHNLAAGLVNLDEMLTSLSLDLFGWPVYFALAVPALPFLLRRDSALDRLYGLIFGLFVAVYVGYFYHGIALGPRYYFEALPALVLLTARGLSVLADSVAALRCPATRRADRAVGGVVSALVLSLLACNLVYFLPRQVELYDGFSGVPGRRGYDLSGFVEMGPSGPTVGPTNALITTDDWWVYAVGLAAMNSPSLDGDAVFALMPPGDAGGQLLAAFAGRSWYRVVPRDGRWGLEEQGVIPPP